MSNRHSTKGFSLLEILVAMVIIAIGALGIAGLQATALKYSKNSETRALAVQISNDLIERMKANKVGLQGGEYGSLTTTVNGATCPTAGSVTPAAVANAATDIANWKSSLGCLPRGRGSVAFVPGTLPDDPEQISVTVIWDEARLRGGSADEQLVTRTLL